MALGTWCALLYLIFKAALRNWVIPFLRQQAQEGAVNWLRSFSQYMLTQLVKVALFECPMPLDRSQAIFIIHGWGWQGNVWIFIGWTICIVSQPGNCVFPTLSLGAFTIVPLALSIWLFFAAEWKLIWSSPANTQGILFQKHQNDFTVKVFPLRQGHRPWRGDEEGRNEI